MQFIDDEQLRAVTGGTKTGWWEPDLIDPPHLINVVEPSELRELLATLQGQSQRYIADTSIYR